MIQWIALGLFLYILSKIWGILSPILKMSQTIKNNQQKTEVHKKIKKWIFSMLNLKSTKNEPSQKLVKHQKPILKQF